MISILGQNIKRIRELKGISAYKLAKLADIGNSTVSQIESGKRQTLNGSTIEKIAKALNVDVNQLVKLEDDQEYEMSELEELISAILNEVDITIDNVLMTEEEKKEFEMIANVAINLIRKKRSNNETNCDL